ncbi:MAG: BPSS1780 family membrane protein [Burkholderiaceae bacterium]
MSLRILAVPPRQGARWVSQGFSGFLKKPLPYTSLLALFLFACLVLLALPYIGGLLVLCLLPLLGLGFMIATRSAQEGGPVHIGHLFAPFRASTPAEVSRRTTLMRLCGVFALASAATMLLGDAFDGGSFERLQTLMAATRSEANQAQIDAVLAEPALRWALAWRLGVTALLSIPFWHAPALVWWHGQGVGQALFSSWLACWRNRGAFAIYGLGWAFTIVLFGIAAGSVFALLGTPQLVPLAAIPAGLMFTTAFYVSLYFTFSDSFASAQDTETAPADGESPPA